MNSHVRIGPVERQIEDVEADVIPELRVHDAEGAAVQEQLHRLPIRLRVQPERQRQQQRDPHRERPRAAQHPVRYRSSGSFAAFAAEAANSGRDRYAHTMAAKIAAPTSSVTAVNRISRVTRTVPHTRR